MRKGQMSHLFIYIFALVVFMTILFFGYRAITEFMGRGERIAFITFKTNLEKTIKEASSYGSRRVFDRDNPFKVPIKYEEICFVDLDKAATEDAGPLIYDAWNETESYEAGDQNVFLKPLAPDNIKVFKITTGDDGYICFNVSEGNVYMQLEGKGDHTFITDVS